MENNGSQKFTTESQARYTAVAAVLHWMIAVLVIANLILGIGKDSFLDFGPPGFTMNLHASLGLSVLFLAVARIVWRLLNPPPALPANVSPPAKALAALTHFALYAALILLPLTGWAILSANPPPNSAGEQALLAEGKEIHTRSSISFWGIVDVPVMKDLTRLGESPGGARAQMPLHDAVKRYHVAIAAIISCLILLHIVGAFSHRGLIYRMMPGSMRKPVDNQATNSGDDG